MGIITTCTNYFSGLSKTDIEDFIENNESIDSKTRRKINSIFKKCDDGTGDTIKSDGVLQGLEIKNFFQNIGHDLAEKFKKQFFSPLLNNNIIETIGEYTYNSESASIDKTNDLKIFDDYLSQNEYLFDDERMELLNQLRENIKSGTISFKNGLSETEVKNLFNLETSLLKDLVNNKIDTSELRKQDTNINKMINNISEGDYSDFCSHNFMNANGSKDLVIILQSYQEQNGVNLYDSLIEKYKNNEISKDEFSAIMTKLLDSIICNDVPEYLCDLVFELDSLRDDILQDNISLDKMKNFDFNKYFQGATIPDINKLIVKYNKAAKTLQEIKELRKYDISTSQVAKFLPSIETKVLSDVKSVQIFNGKEYVIENDNDLILITDTFYGKTYNINLNKLLVQVDDDEIKNKIKQAMLQMSAPVLIDLSIEVDTFILESEESEVSALYIPDNNVIAINKDSEGDIKNCPVNLIAQIITHEIGHSLDACRQSDGFNDYNLQNNTELMSIANAEYKALKEQNLSDAKMQYASTHPQELFAECYTLLNTGTSFDSNYVIANYFPKTLEYIAKYMETQRELPADTRKADKNKIDIESVSRHDWEYNQQDLDDD